VSRREQVLDAAITVLGGDGSRGLTHRAVDAAAGVPAGTTSNHNRTREALLAGIVTRLAELDRADWDALAGRTPADAGCEAGPFDRGLRSAPPADGPADADCEAGPLDRGLRSAPPADGPADADCEAGPLDRGLRSAPPADGPADAGCEAGPLDRGLRSAPPADGPAGGVDDLVLVLSGFVRHVTGPGLTRTAARYALFLDAATRPELRAALMAARGGIVTWATAWVRHLGLADPVAHTRIMLTYLDGLILGQVCLPEPGFDPAPGIRAVLTGLLK
jgi:hypothetical protein